LSWEDAAKIGNVVASFVVASQGTLDHHFTKQDVERQLQETYSQTILF
jgi:sugar/nucleoside kinase (ribokinase family)